MNGEERKVPKTLKFPTLRRLGVEESGAEEFEKGEEGGDRRGGPGQKTEMNSQLNAVVERGSFRVSSWGPMAVDITGTGFV